MSGESSDFTIGEQLAGGGFSVVCRGTFKGSEVAIKKVQIDRLTPKRADREFDVMRMLDHPTVLKLLHVEERNEIRFT